MYIVVQEHLGGRRAIECKFNKISREEKLQQKKLDN